MKITLNIGEYIRALSVFGYFPLLIYVMLTDTDTLGISETINPTKKCVMNKIFIII